MAEIITNTGLRLPDEFTEDQFFEAGRFLSRIEQGMQWAIGDWYNAIPWGDKEAACAKAGLNYFTAKNYANVCDAFQMSLRNDNVSFDCHRRIAIRDLTPEQRADLLAQAETHGWSSARLAKERDSMLGKPEKIPLLSFDGKVDRVLETLPKTASNKIRGEIKRVMEDLKHEFEKEVHHVAQERVKQQREKLLQMEREAEEEKKRLRDLRQNIDGLMTEDEYRLIRGCLHPDRAPEERRDQFSKAFEIFTRLEKSVNRDMPAHLRKARGWN